MLMDINIMWLNRRKSYWEEPIGQGPHLYSFFATAPLGVHIVTNTITGLNNNDSDGWLARWPKLLVHISS